MRRRRRRTLIPSAIGLMVGAGAGVLARLVEPDTLDALLVPLVLLLALPILLISAASDQRWIATGVTVFAATTSLIAVGVRPPFEAIAIYAAFAALLVGSCDAFVFRPGQHRGYTRAACITIVAISWLLWPIWLAPQLVTWQFTLPAWSTELHPIFAINAAAIERGIWTEMPLPYRLTPLGQDLVYAMPNRAGRAILAHVVIGVAGFGIGILRRSRRRASRTRGTGAAAT